MSACNGRFERLVYDASVARPVHPDREYSPAEMHGVADAVPLYPLAHVSPVNVADKLGTSKLSALMT